MSHDKLQPFNVVQKINNQLWTDC